VSIRLPARKPSYRFVLTPLADAMFQLLIFFMLSSSLTPYSLLTLQTAPQAPGEAAPGQADEAAQVAEAAPADVALWTVDVGAVIVGGQRFEFDALPDLAGALGSASAPADVILLIRKSAQMQDITTVLEALQEASVGSVQITSGAL